MQDRVVVVYGATGSVGSAVSRSYAEAGAMVVLVGRDGERVADLSAALDADGHAVRNATVDVLDTSAVAEHAAQVGRDTGRLDVVFNAVTYDDVQGASLADLDIDVFARRMHNTVLAQYGVAQAAARIMIEQRHGAILTVVGDGRPYPGLGTSAVSWALVVGMLRQWAADLGPHGVRVAWLRTGGFRESILGHRDYGSSYAGDADAQEVLAAIEDDTLLGTAPSLAEAGRAAVYLAVADGLTAVGLNLTAGSMSD